MAIDVRKIARALIQPKVLVWILLACACSVAIYIAVCGAVSLVALWLLPDRQARDFEATDD